jgi:hypothetical protein
MLQRTFMIATTLGLGLTLLVAPAQAGHGRGAGRGQCIGAARSAKKACVVDCVDSFRTDFQSCFGSGSDCAQNCLTARQSCEASPLQKLHACSGDTSNPDSCRSKLKAALAACKGDPNRIPCSNQAQVDALKCRQACVDAQAPTLEVCRSAYRLCLHGCKSSPSGAFLDLDR